MCNCAVQKFKNITTTRDITILVDLFSLFPSNVGRDIRHNELIYNWGGKREGGGGGSGEANRGYVTQVNNHP